MTIQTTGTAFRPLFHSGCHCPACGGTAWTVGRITAECVRCGTALTLGHTTPPSPSGEGSGVGPVPQNATGKA